MKLVWHIIRNDLRRDKWPLLLWALIGLGQTGIGLALLGEDGTDLPAIDLLWLNSILLLIVFHVMGYLLALRWVQADEVAGTRMFWVTRPISGGRLFAAKAAGLLALFGLLPVLLWVPWWIHCGIGWRDMAWLAAETSGWQLLLVAPALLIGSLTADYGRAIMWSLLLCASWLAWSAFGQATLASADFRQFGRAFFGIWFSRLWVAGLLLIAGFTAIAAGQFVARNTVQTLGRVTILALLVVLVGRLWVVDFSEELAGLTEPVSPHANSGLADRLVLSPTKGRVTSFRDYERIAGKRQEVRTLFVSINVDGLPTDTLLEGKHDYQEVAFGDGTTFRATSRNQSGTVAEPVIRRLLSLPHPAADAETIAWGRARLAKTNADRVARGLSPFEDNWDARFDQSMDRPTLQVGFSMPRSTSSRMRDHPPSYATQVKGLLTSVEIVQRLPLQGGERGMGRSRPLRVTSVDNWVVKLSETTPAFRRYGWFFSRWRDQQRPLDQTMPRLYTANQRIGALHSVRRRSLVPTPIVVGGVSIAWTETVINPDRWIRGGAWVTSDPEWVQHTEIVVVMPRMVEEFAREIRTDQLPIQWPLDEPNGEKLPDAQAVASAGN